MDKVRGLFSRLPIGWALPQSHVPTPPEREECSHSNAKRKLMLGHKCPPDLNCVAIARQLRYEAQARKAIKDGMVMRY